jgi:hypothetical protein
LYSQTGRSRAAAATGSGFTWMVTPLASPLTMMDCDASA